MKIIYCFGLAVICIFLNSCRSENEIKIPGSFESMQMLTASRSYPNSDIIPSGYGKALDHHQKYFADKSEEKNSVEPWEAMGPKNTAGRCLALAINPLADSTVYMGTASGGLWRSRRLGLGESWEYVPTGHHVLGVSSIAFAPGDSMTMYIGTGEVYNIVQTGNDGAYRATRGSYGVGILKSIDGGATWAKSLDWTYQNQRGVQSIKIDQDNPNIIFAATTLGVFRSLNSGVTWAPVLDVAMVTDIEINGDIIIAACGNLGSINKGMYRSIDGGDSWEPIVDFDLPTDFQGKIELAAAPSDPDIVYASIGNGFGFSDGATWLCRSTDAGENWKLMNQEDYSKWQGWFAHDVAVHPTNPDTIMAIGIDIYKSEFGGGILTQKTFGGVTLGTPAVGLPDGGPNYSHSDHHVVLYHSKLEDVILFGNDGGLFLSFDGGDTYQSANGGLQTTQFYNGFSVSHQNPDFAMGGLQDNSTSIFRGSDAWQRAVGGDGSWTGINFLNDQKVFASSQRLNMAGSVNGGLSFFGVFPTISDDEPIFIAPYVIAQSKPEIMYAAGQYIYVSDDEGRNWSVGNNGQKLNGDPVYSLAVSPTNPDVVYAATAPFISQSSLFVSTDGGNTFNEVNNSNFPDRFINDITVDPDNEAIIYIGMSGFGSAHLLVSKDYGESFEDITNGLPDAPANAIEIDPTNSDHIYFGNDLGVYFSENAGQTWEAFDTGLFESVIAMDLKVSPVDRKIWVATHGNGAFRRDLVAASTSSQDINDPRLDLVSNLYPNPNLGAHLTIDLKEGQPRIATVEILEISGSIIPCSINKNESNIKVDFGSKLPQGIYLVQLSTDNGNNVIHKFVVDY